MVISLVDGGRRHPGGAYLCPMYNALLVLLCCSFALTAQQTVVDTVAAFPKRLEVGVGFGVMQHDIDLTPNRSTEVLQGNNFGVALRYFDHKFVGFQAELSYSEAGWQEDFGEDFSELYSRRFSYAEFLILTQFSFGQGAVQPLIQAGPYLAAPLSDDETLPAGFTPAETIPPPYYGTDISFRLNYGLQIGAGLNVQLGALTLQVDGRYLIGFSDLIKGGETIALTSRRTGIGGHVAVFYALQNE